MFISTTITFTFEIIFWPEWKGERRVEGSKGRRVCEGRRTFTETKGSSKGASTGCFEGGLRRGASKGSWGLRRERRTSKGEEGFEGEGLRRERGQNFTFFFFPRPPPFSFSLGGPFVGFWWCLLKRQSRQMCTFGLSGCRVKPRRAEGRRGGSGEGREGGPGKHPNLGADTHSRHTHKTHKTTTHHNTPQHTTTLRHTHNPKSNWLKSFKKKVDNQNWPKSNWPTSSIHLKTPSENT